MQKVIPFRPSRYTQGQNVSKTPQAEGLRPLVDMVFGIVAALGSKERSMRPPLQNVVYLSFDKLPVNDGTITGGLQVTKLDGTVVAAYSVSQAYSASGTGTMDALKTTITNKDADFTVELLPDAAGNIKRVVKITAGADKKLVVSTAFTSNGTTPPAITPKYSCGDVLRGATWHRHVGQNIDGSGIYLKAAEKQLEDVINIGDCAMLAAGTPKKGDRVYVLYAEYNGMPAGSVRPNDDNGAAPVVHLPAAVFDGPINGGLAPVSYLIV